MGALGHGGAAMSRCGLVGLVGSAGSATLGKLGLWGGHALRAQRSG
jgi:hypothetical protein